MSNLRRVVLGFALLLALIENSSARSRHHSPANEAPKADQSAASNQRGTPDQPFTVNVVPTADQKADAEKKDLEARLKAATDEKLVRYAGYQVLIGIVTFLIFILQLLAFSLQARYMRRTVIEMRHTTHATIRAARATQKSADAAKVAAEALPRLERAYLFFSSATCPAITSSHTIEANMFDIFDVTYEYKNSGRTPALLQKVQIGAQYLEFGFPTDIEFTFGNEKLPHTQIVGQSETAKAGHAQLRVSGGNFDKAKVGLGKLFFWSKLTYLDVLGVTHETGMCSEWHFGQSRFVISNCDALNYYT